jgi:hypothetical protein
MSLCLGFSIAFSQTGTGAKLDNDEIKSLTSKLGIKLLLNDTQKNSIQNILTEYSQELTKLNVKGSEPSSINSKSGLISSSETKIISLLDDKQKMKYDIIKKEWWGSISTEEGD